MTTEQTDSVPVQLELFGRIVEQKAAELTFGQAFALFVEHHWKYKKTKKNRRTDRMEGRLESMFFGRMLHTFSRNDIHLMRKRMLDEGLSIFSINKAHMIMTVLFNKMYEWREDGWLGGHDLSGIRLPRVNPGELVPKYKEPGRERALVPWEVRRLYTFAKRLNDWDMVDIIRMAIWCRLSPMDIYGLKDAQIDEANFRIDIRRGHTKTDRNPLGELQRIPMTERMWGLIDRRRKLREPDSTLIFNFRNFRKRLQKLRRYAMQHGIADFQLRDFRRTGATHLLESGKVDLKSVSKGLGHTTTRITEANYTPISDKGLRRSTEILVEEF